ncbi:hypothetical protein M422DRAFT_252597 [Sphaerobolus stellatus SS14]|uniref:Sfi1 spindle body domain-containing protein n=1 Tax=Sphaerobolus stellatus (strain SS14) TaxID=990650 RepID=A0A0C9VYL3_SPHS4|nr:hypothetical protein M422DRAFT_252597 [Sphaerobolus stellatus SS14]
MSDAERYISAKVAYRMLTTSFDTWLRNLDNHRRAEAFNKRRMLINSIKTWQKAQNKNRALEVREDKYTKRRDRLLLRAVIRVWIARERGQLLDRVRHARLMSDAFTVWRHRLKEQGASQNVAVNFADHSSRQLLASVFAVWSRRQQELRHSESMADQVYAANLLYNSLLSWRLKLREQLRLYRKGKTARTYFLERNAWDKWRLVLATKRRERKLAVLQKTQVKHHFDCTRVIIFLSII